MSRSPPPTQLSRSSSVNTTPTNTGFTLSRASTTDTQSPTNERTPLRPAASTVSTHTDTSGATAAATGSSPHLDRRGNRNSSSNPNLRPNRSYGAASQNPYGHHSRAGSNRQLSSTTSLHSYDRPRCPHNHSAAEPCEHGGFSPHASPRGGRSRSGSADSSSSAGGKREGGPGREEGPLLKVDEEDNESERAGRKSRDRDKGLNGDFVVETTSPQPRTVPASEGGGQGGIPADERRDLKHRILGDMLAEGVLGDDGGSGGGQSQGDGKDGKTHPATLDGVTDAISTTQWLARRHGVKGRRKMYLAYYIPFFNWITQYKWSFFQGDLIAALTMASFYIPMSLSYAANLGHIPPINGLYSFVFNPIIYAILGTCPQMVVGPEAAGSLLVGSVVKSSVDKVGKEDDEINARIAGVVTGMAGAVIFIAGLTRLGFLESVLSRPFLRGFISAIGFVILVDQLIPETGLASLSNHAKASHGSCLDKLEFLFMNIKDVHGPTCAVSFGSFAIIMVCRYETFKHATF